MCSGARHLDLVAGVGPGLGGDGRHRKHLLHEHKERHARARAHTHTHTHTQAHTHTQQRNNGHARTHARTAWEAGTRRHGSSQARARAHLQAPAAHAERALRRTLQVPAVRAAVRLRSLRRREPQRRTANRAVRSRCRTRRATGLRHVPLTSPSRPPAAHHALLPPLTPHRRPSCGAAPAARAGGARPSAACCIAARCALAQSGKPSSAARCGQGRRRGAAPEAGTGPCAGLRRRETGAAGRPGQGARSEHPPVRIVLQRPPPTHTHTHARPLARANSSDRAAGRRAPGGGGRQRTWTTPMTSMMSLAAFSPMLARRTNCAGAPEGRSRAGGASLPVTGRPSPLPVTCRACESRAGGASHGQGVRVTGRGVRAGGASCDSPARRRESPGPATHPFPTFPDARARARAHISHPPVLRRKRQSAHAMSLEPAP